MKDLKTDDSLSTLYGAATVVINEDLQILHWNNFAQSYFGYTLSEVTSDDFTFDQLFSSNMESFSQVLNATNNLIRFDSIQGLSKSKNILSVSLLATPTTYENNRVFTVHILPSENVTAIQTSSASLSDLKEGIMNSFMTVILDNEGFIINTNSAFLKTSHWTPKRVIGKTFWNLFPTDESNLKIVQNIWRTISNGTVWQGQVEKITKDGEHYWVLLTAIPLSTSSIGQYEYLLVEHDITKDKLIQLQLEKIAYIDTETGLMNVHRLQQIVTDMIQDGRHFSFVYLSIDNFYTLKDLHSTSIGANLIVEFTKRLKMYFQDSHMARVNENDFVVITPLPEWFIQGFLTYLQQHPIYNGSSAIPLSLSGGITRYPEDQTMFSELMKASIATIAQVREAGGGSIFSLSKASHKALNRKSIVEKRLLLALDNENLKVLYQPQYDIKTGKVTAVEAFVRWEDDEIGVVSPDELIPIAEETGLINNIGKFMLQQACMQAVKWQEQGLNLKVSINSSVREFRDKNMAKSILETLAATGCPSNLIQLEITEKFALEAEAEQSIIQQMRKLEAEGITFTLDDFGTGYASFRYLQLLPIQILKIDQTFTNSVLQSEKQQRLMHGMVQLGQSMNLTVLAEGVETEEQKDLLTSFGCDALQGYFFSKPVTASEITHRYSK